MGRPAWALVPLNDAFDRTHRQDVQPSVTVHVRDRDLITVGDFGHPVRLPAEKPARLCGVSLCHA